jgi:hypothetical protein
VARAVKFPRLCFEFFLVRHMRRSARRMVLTPSTWTDSQSGSSGWPQSAAITHCALSIIGHDALHHLSVNKVNKGNGGCSTFRPTPRDWSWILNPPPPSPWVRIHACLHSNCGCVMNR